MLSAEERLKWAYTFCKYDDKDLNLDFWQDAFVRSKSRFTGIVKSRRVGFSFIVALKELVKAQDMDRKNFTAQFVSYNESDAAEKIIYATQFYESIPEEVRKKIVVRNKTELQFLDKGGKTVSRLISIPCRPPRGKGGDIILDEYGIYLPKMSNAIYTAALPVISRGGCISVGSSPLGKVGKFYEIITDRHNFPSYQIFNVPWWFCRDLCVNVPLAIKSQIQELSTQKRVEKFGTRIIQEIFKSMPIDQFQQEYECFFIDEAESYIPLELIYENTPGMNQCDILIQKELDENITDDEYWNYNRDEDFIAYSDIDLAILNYNPDLHGGPLFFGYDVAKSRDGTSIYLIGNKDGKKRSFFRFNKRGISFEAQLDLCRKIYKNLPIQKGCMDSTGLGANMYETLHKEFGDRIIGVDFTQATKEDMAISVKLGLERHEFMLESDKDFHRAIHSIKRSSGTNGHFKYDADRNENGHADDFWSWALAERAYRMSAVSNQDFYSQYRQSKESSINLESNRSIQETSEGQRKQRGKSLNSVLRGVKHANNRR